MRGQPVQEVDDWIAAAAGGVARREVDSKWSVPASACERKSPPLSCRARRGEGERRHMAADHAVMPLARAADSEVRRGLTQTRLTARPITSRRTHGGPRTETTAGRSHRLTSPLGGGLIACSSLSGSLGVYRYTRGFWLYRGFPPPTRPGLRHLEGNDQRLYVASPALGGRRQPVDVYLPPATARTRAALPGLLPPARLPRPARGLPRNRRGWVSSRTCSWRRGRSVP